MGRDEDPLSLNRYTYVLNDPLMYWDPTGHAEVSLRDLAGATGSTIQYDNKTKTTTVTVTSGYKVEFKAGQDGVKIENGRMVIDNEVFDAKMSGTQNGATVKVDSFVSDEVKSKGKVVETAKAAVITQVTTPYETLRDTAVAFDVSSHKTLKSIKTSDVPNLNEPGSGLYYSQPKSLLIGLALTDGDILNDYEVKALHLSYNNLEVQKFNMMSVMANQYGANILYTEFQHNINSGFNNYAATGISFRPKVGLDVTAPLEQVNIAKNNTNGKNAKDAGKGGPGVNRLIDEFDDTETYKGAAKSRTTQGAGDLIDTSPIKIPSNAVKVEQAKNGYDQVKYTWSDGTYKYEARWHTRTPGAPADQGDTWVVTRTTPGSQTTRKQQHILTGENQWTSMKQWQDAVSARQNGTATAEQQALLDSGHWPAK